MSSQESTGGYAMQQEYSTHSTHSTHSHSTPRGDQTEYRPANESVGMSMAANESAGMSMAANENSGMRLAPKYGEEDMETLSKS